MVGAKRSPSPAPQPKSAVATSGARVTNGGTKMAITASLFTRFASRQDDSPQMKMIAALRNQFGGHAVRAVEATLFAAEEPLEIRLSGDAFVTVMRTRPRPLAARPLHRRLPLTSSIGRSAFHATLA